MTRRFALAAFLCLSATSALAQTAITRIGYLGPSAETAPKLLQAFKDGLAARGYEEGRNLVIEYRWTNAGANMNDDATLVASARDLVARKVSVIAASIDPAILAASRATKTVPIVMLNATDPVRIGVVQSLSHPGGNVTGMSNTSYELIGRRLQTLRDTVPDAKRIGMLASGASSTKDMALASARAAAGALGVRLDVVEAPAPAALAGAFETLSRAGPQALLLVDTGGGIFFTQRKRIAELALAHRLPAMTANAENVEAGALMSVSQDSVGNYRRAADFIDRILKGGKPADIPVEQATTFELTINMSTAKALGVTIPQSVRMQASNVLP
jgi:putative ABC transport system substrate-binding protein